MTKNFYSQWFVHCFSVSCVATTPSASEVSYCIKFIWPMVWVGREFELLGSCSLAWHFLDHNMEEKGKGNLSIDFVHKDQSIGWHWFRKTFFNKSQSIHMKPNPVLRHNTDPLMNPNLHHPPGWYITFHQADNNSVSSRSHFSQGSPCSVASLRIHLHQMYLSEYTTLKPRHSLYGSSNSSI